MELTVDVVAHAVEQRLEPRDVVVSRGLLAQIGEGRMRAIETRREKDDSLELAFRLFETAKYS